MADTGPEPILITVNGREVPLPADRMVGKALRRCAGLRRGTRLYRSREGRLEPVGHAELLELRPGDAFLSEPPRDETASFTVNTAMSSLAIVISLVSILLTEISSDQTTRQNNARDALRNVFNIYFDLPRLQLQAPETMHPFSLPATYAAVCRDVSHAIADDAARRTRLPLSERAMANYLFAFYEWVLRDARSAEGFGDAQRLEFDNKTIAFLQDYLLRNPRLLWYWAPEGGNLGEEYETETQAAYRGSVLAGGTAVLSQDMVGPLGATGCLRGTEQP
jgi:hypothetical protein